MLTLKYIRTLNSTAHSFSVWARAVNLICVSKQDGAKAYIANEILEFLFDEPIYVIHVPGWSPY